MDKILCFVDRKLVEEETFFSEFEKATNGMELYEIEDKQELISTLGYQKVNGVDFHIVDLEDKNLMLYDNDRKLYWEFEMFEEFMESLKYSIEIAMEYDLEEENIEEMSGELALEYALQIMFLDNNYEYIVNSYTYRVEDIEE